MSTLLKNPKDWTEDDLKSLIKDKVEEYARLEYKREVDLSDKGQKKEACKDVSAFANGQGGKIIYGMEEEKRKDLGSIPKAIKPITGASIKESLENVLLSGVSPKLHFWIHSISVKGGYCLIVQIPQSSSTHMVTLGKDCRYYIRRNFQSSRMTEQEVQVHYSRAFQAKEEADQRYHSERAEITGKEQTIHLVSMPPIHQPRLVDLRKHTVETFRPKTQGYMRQKHMDWIYELSGNEFLFKLGDDTWSRIKRSGTCEHIFSFDLTEYGGKKNFPSKAILEDLHDFLLHYGRVYAAVAYYGPVKVYYRLVNTKGAVLGVGDRHWFKSRPQGAEDEFNYDVDTYVDTLLSSPLTIVHEIMDYVWIFFGYEGGCEYFDEDSTLNEHWKHP